MANKLRGGQDLWTATAVGVGGTSNVAYVDGDQTVAIFMSNTGGTNTVITVQASDNRTPTAGRNSVPSTWYNYVGADSITLNAGASICFDLSPFGPSFLRLSSSAATTIDAFATVVG